MPAKLPHRCALALLVVQLTALPVLAQEAPDASVATDGGDQSTVADPTSGQSPAPDQAAAPTRSSNIDVGAVIAKWGPAPKTGNEFNTALAQRWFRNQNQERSRWGVPTSSRDPYLDWTAENLLRDYLGEAHVDLPPGVNKPVAMRTQTDSGVRAEPVLWTVSDDLWQSVRDQTASDFLSQWEADNPGSQWYTKDSYIQLHKQGKTPHFDRFRLMGVAGRVNTAQPAKQLLSGEDTELEAIAPGATARTSQPPMTTP